MKHLALTFLILIVTNFCLAEEPKTLSNEEEVSYYPESHWGQSPVKVTKELVCKQHPKLCGDVAKVEEKTL